MFVIKTMYSSKSNKNAISQKWYSVFFCLFIYFAKEFKFPCHDVTMSLKSEKRKITKSYLAGGRDDVEVYNKMVCCFNGTGTESGRKSG